MESSEFEMKLDPDLNLQEKQDDGCPESRLKNDVNFTFYFYLFFVFFNIFLLFVVFLFIVFVFFVFVFLFLLFF